MNGTWTVKTVPHHPRRRWYALHWNGIPLPWLINGRPAGRYKYRRDAQARADELNKRGAQAPCAMLTEDVQP